MVTKRGESMKKFLILLISIFIFMNSSIFASSEYIEFLSGEQDDGAIYLDSYEDYMNAIGDVNEQDYYKEEYNNTYLIQGIKKRVKKVGD